ncbi:protein of unknown function DUF2800 [Microcystis phage MJing1]|nr:protein of unknown function DUF2800 [Microcystis phage MJing1]
MTEPALAPTGHSIVGMSVLERRLGCPGSAHAEAGLAETRIAEAAARGTELHEAAAKALYSGVTGEDVWEEDEEGVEIIDEYLRVVRGVQQRLGGKLLIEHRFHLADLHPELFGTADAVVIAPPVLAVIDLKTGRGHRVDVRRPDGRPNLQLSGYGLGGLMAVPPGVAIDTLELHVVQPLNGGHTTTSLDAMEITDIAADIQQIVQEALAPDAPRVPGDWCRWCKAAASCPALQAAALDAASVEFDVVADEGATAMPAPSEMTPEDVARALRAADALDLWISAVRQHAYGEAERGRTPPGFKLVARKGRRKWRAGQETGAATLLQNLGLPRTTIFTEKMVSVAQAEKALKAAKIPAPAATVWADLVDPGNTGTTLVPESDPRPAIASGAASEFSADPLA